MNVATAFGPASETSTSPFGSSATANGTSPARVFTVGAADRVPSPLTANTSTALLAAFVVTNSALPSGLKDT